MAGSRYGSAMGSLAQLDGKVAVITGTGGLGFELARMLASRGAEVILAGRNREKGQAALAQLNKGAADPMVRFEQLDLADLSSVAECGARLRSVGQAIDILVNNAGIMSPPRRKVSADGFEAQFATNHLGHFALTAQLLPLLRRAASARVVHVTSLAHHHGKLDFEDLQSERNYRPGVAYCRSKLAVALFARALHRRAAQEGWPIASMAAHPGFSGTNLFAAEGGGNRIMAILSKRVLVPLIGQSANDGALPILFAAASPLAQSGQLYGPSGFMDMKGPPGERKFADTALDEEAADRLWRVSEELTGMRFVD